MKSMFLSLTLIYFTGCSDFTVKKYSPQESRTKVFFELNCSYCHGLDGMGFDSQKKPVLDKKFAMAATDPKCIHCHGDQEYTLASPSLAGQRRAYLENALKMFRSGERANIHMNKVAKDLDDKQISELAEYINHMRFRQP